MNLEQKIEAILFFKNEPVSIDKLSIFLEESKENVLVSLESLKSNLTTRGIVLLETNGEVALGTNKECSSLIESLQKEELNKELSRASLETLTIILYRNGITRAELDYIRGVNSGFSLRTLSIRGLIEKIVDPKDSRKYIYKPTLELLSYLGMQSINELPDFQEISNKLTNSQIILDNLNEKNQN